MDKKQNYKIAIIGWTWRYWQFWKKYFESKWNSVIVTWRSSEITSEEALVIADIIIISVSIRNTVKVIRELIPFIPENKLLLDFTWIKKDSLKEMKKYKKWEIIWTHPMFWPNVPSLSKQNIAFDPVKPWKKWKYIFELWKSDWANMIKMTAKRHDELIWIIQPATHFINFIFGYVLQKKWVHPEELIAISTPVSRMQTYIFSRFLWQQAGLYSDMQICNSTYKKEILSLINKKTKKLTKIIKSNDFEKFEEEFTNLKNFIWNDFLEKAMIISTDIDERLKKEN